jgi:hypothetical protein
MGGTYSEENVISVNVAECDKNTASHAMWHYANWQLYGKLEDKMAWLGLAGYLGKEELIHERLIMGGKTTGKKNAESGHMSALGKKNGIIAMSPGGWLYENRIEYGRLGGKKVWELGIGLASLNHSEKAKKLYADGKGLAAMSKEERIEASKKAGRIGGRVNALNKTGICGISKQKRSERTKITNSQKWKCNCCDFVSNAKGVNRHLCEKHDLDKSNKHKFFGNVVQ